jgi:CHAT domain-containing protein
VERVTTVMEDYDVLHIASHARVSEEYPLYSSIDLFDRKIGLYELFRHQPPRRMVILSACESGLTSGLSSEYYNSEELVGFHRAFLNAGVPTVIASLWLVEDRATSDLMNLFYQSLSTGSTVLDAFSEAQRRLIKQSKQTSDRLHPFFWGAFKLAGETR